jgi:hypothetical protein
MDMHIIVVQAMSQPDGLLIAFTFIIVHFKGLCYTSQQFAGGHNCAPHTISEMKGFRQFLAACPFGQHEIGFRQPQCPSLIIDFVF